MKLTELLTLCESEDSVVCLNSKMRLRDLVDALNGMARLFDMMETHFTAPEDAAVINRLRAALARAEEVK